MDWTSLGDVSWPLWRTTLNAVDSPILDDGQLAHDAAKPHSALCLVTMEQASKLGTAYRDCDEHNNPFLFELSGSFPGLMTFESWADAIHYWKDHSLPHYGNLGESATWWLTNRVAQLLEQDRIGTFGHAVPGYLDEDGNPTEETLRRYFGIGNPQYDAENDPVFALWRTWSFDHGVFPQAVNKTVTGPVPGEPIEMTFSNGLRIFYDGATARVVGSPETSR